VECAGDGICTGECSGDERRCDPETRRPQTCDDNGAWRNASGCSGRDVCVTATGECGACRFDSDCPDLLLCFDGECAQGDCLDDDECPSGLICEPTDRGINRCA
jgi:hypothetical protein